MIIEKNRILNFIKNNKNLSIQELRKEISKEFGHISNDEIEYLIKETFHSDSNKKIIRFIKNNKNLSIQELRAKILKEFGHISNNEMEFLLKEAFSNSDNKEIIIDEETRKERILQNFVQKNKLKNEDFER